MDPHEPDRDWTYSEGCGCRVTFFGASEGRASRMLPGADCDIHLRRDQIQERDLFLERARRAYLDALAGCCDHEWTGKQTGGPGDPQDWVEYCKKCGMENPGSWVPEF